MMTNELVGTALEYARDEEWCRLSRSVDVSMDSGDMGNAAENALMACGDRFEERLGKWFSEFCPAALREVANAAINSHLDRITGAI
jgi:hypothetical protein